MTTTFSSEPWREHIDRNPRGVIEVSGHSWRDLSLGSRARAALFLATEVGEGGVFTGLALRYAIPDVTEIDRRARELRPLHAWKTASYKTDRTLRPEQHRLEVIGDHLWLPGIRARRPSGISRVQVRRVVERDGYCKVCGAVAGMKDPFPPYGSVVLTAGHKEPAMLAQEGSRLHDDDLQAECAGCNEQAQQYTGTPEDLPRLAQDTRRLNRADRQQLKRWVQAGKRDFTLADTLYARIHRLTAPERAAFLAEMRRIYGAADGWAA
ncbi:hypothetical protein CLV92_102179 [Kineococcus xinjiangensis]|uniref:HNH endonuclease n=1 Tax=Kineococcus xinjiangensis TaxID=512762 RepID=A0A2S6IUW6_9ACTN|nr:hypothetical protein [Kineococcus xinjiangensis]PPK98026.1 hypothetical protein CLV92_102179 [Kineococcus xinjiangensis]